MLLFIQYDLLVNGFLLNPKYMCGGCGKFDRGCFTACTIWLRLVMIFEICRMMFGYHLCSLIMLWVCVKSLVVTAEFVNPKLEVYVRTVDDNLIFWVIREVSSL